MGLGERGMKKVFAVCLLLVSGCSMTGDGSRWKYMGPEHVRCLPNELKVCERIGALTICECAMA